MVQQILRCIATPIILTILRILLAENQRVIASQAISLLRGWGHEITYCGHDGHKVLAAVSHRPPDLILTGFRLKGSMQGIELVSRLQARWDIPVVVVSGVTFEELPAAWRDRAGLYFLSKPFVSSQLHAIIQQASNNPPTNFQLGPNI